MSYPRSKYLLVVILTITASLILSACGKDSDDSSSSEKNTETTSTSSKSWTSAPEQSLKENTAYTATLETSEGTIVIELLPEEAPIAVNNFVFLANENFYDNLTFHRVIENFMVQTGDPAGDGTGGPGYTIKNDPVTLSYDKGIVAMANTGAPDTAGSQFFIVHGEDVSLPTIYSIFGRVTEGLDTLDKIAVVPVEDNGGGEISRPIEDVMLEKVTIKESSK